jgi:hypothetical protein
MTLYDFEAPYCDQPAKILEIEPQEDPRRTVHQTMPAVISPQMSVKVLAAPAPRPSSLRSEVVAGLPDCLEAVANGVDFCRE